MFFSSLPFFKGDRRISRMFAGFFDLRDSCWLSSSFTDCHEKEGTSDALKTQRQWIRTAEEIILKIRSDNVRWKIFVDLTSNLFHSLVGKIFLSFSFRRLPRLSRRYKLSNLKINPAKECFTCFHSAHGENEESFFFAAPLDWRFSLIAMKTKFRGNLNWKTLNAIRSGVSGSYSSLY